MTNAESLIDIIFFYVCKLEVVLIILNDLPVL